MSNTAVIIGATGAVGKELVKNILNNDFYTKVYIFGRKSIENIQDNEKLQKIVIDFENISFDVEALQDADVFATLGTTIKIAGSKENQRKIDVDYTVNFAKVCEGRVRSFNVVSSQGANSSSRNFYSSLKGMLEDALNKLNIGTLRIYRPSILITKRKETRIRESILIKLSPLLKLVLRGKNKKYSPIRVEFLTEEMVRFSIENKKSGVYTYNDFKKA